MTLPGPAQGRRGGRPRALSGCTVSTPHARVYHIVVRLRMRGRLGCCAGAIVAERGPPKPRPLQGPDLTGISSTPHRQPPSRYLFDTTLYRTPVRPLPTPTIPLLGCRKRVMSLQSPLKRALFCPLSPVHRLLAKAGCVRWRAGGMRHTRGLCACPAATDDAHMLGWPFRVLCLLSLFCRSPDGRKWAAGVRTQSASTPQVWCRVRRSNLA